MADVNPNDLPLWIKIVGSVFTAVAFIWAALVTFVEPWADARFMRRVQRCSDPIEKHMREKIFRADAVRAMRRDEKLETLEDRMRKVDASQIQMGEALRDLPKQIKVLERLALTMESVNSTMAGLQNEVKALADEHHEMRGMITAWREPTPNNPLRPRRSRGAS